MNTIITPDQKNIATDSLNFALKSGSEQVRVSFVSACANSFEMRGQSLEKMQQSIRNRLCVELFKCGKYFSFATNRLENSEVQQLITEGLASAQLLATDEHRHLPDSNRYYKNGGGDLEQFDPAIAEISTSQKTELLQNTNAEILGTDERIISVNSSFDDSYTAEYVIDSQGLELYSEESSFGISSEVALKTATDARPESFWYDSSIFWSDLQKTNIARQALKRAIGKIGQRKAPSGKYALLLDNTQSSRLFAPLISAMMGDAIWQKQSFLSDKLRQTVASPLLSVVDNPHRIRSFGARFFDGEGIATFAQPLIENGVLQTFFIDTYQSGKMGVTPTISSPSVLEFKKGDDDFEGLIRAMHNGIWVSGFNGGNTNPTTGDFSLGVEGFRIENGEIAYPIGEMNVTGNILTLWQNLRAVGSDIRTNSPWRIPSLLFDAVDFNGL